MDPVVQMVMEASSKCEPCLERNISEEKVSTFPLFLIHPLLSVWFYSFILEGSLFPGTYSSLTEHSLATVPVALGKNRAYSHCACFPLETFHPVYIILYMAPSHATTSCKNISSYILTMSGLFNDWIQGHQEITYDSVDCLPQADLGILGPLREGSYFAFLEETLKIITCPMLITYLLCCFSQWQENYPAKFQYW